MGSRVNHGEIKSISPFNHSNCKDHLLAPDHLLFGRDALVRDTATCACPPRCPCTQPSTTLVPSIYVADLSDRLRLAFELFHPLGFRGRQENTKVKGEKSLSLVLFIPIVLCYIQSWKP